MASLPQRRIYLIALALLPTLCLSVAATQASALPTKLCNANEETCSAKNTYTLGFENFKGTIASMKLEQTGFLTVSCNPGKFASTLSEGSGPLTGEVWKWNFFECTPEGCSVATPSSEGTGYSAEVEAIGGGNGTMRVGNTPTLVVTCASPNVTCTYKTASMELSVQGGGVEEAAISTSTKLTKDLFKSSFLCRETATYEASHWIVEPGLPVYVTT
jgi:hypothetical protein